MNLTRIQLVCSATVLRIPDGSLGDEELCESLVVEARVHCRAAAHEADVEFVGSVQKIPVLRKFDLLV